MRLMVDCIHRGFSASAFFAFAGWLTLSAEAALPPCQPDWVARKRMAENELAQAKAESEKNLAQLSALLSESKAGRAGLIQLIRFQKEGKPSYQWRIRDHYFIFDNPHWDREKLIEEAQMSLPAFRQLAEQAVSGKKESGRNMVRDLEDLLAYFQSITNEDCRWISESASSQGFLAAMPTVWLGMTVNRSLQPPGVEVKTVEKGGPAERCGLKPQDVILAVEQAAVKSPSELMKALNGYQPGTKVACQVKRPPAIDLKVTFEIVSRPSPLKSEAERLEAKGRLEKELEVEQKDMSRVLGETDQRLTQLERTPLDQFIKEHQPTLTFLKGQCAVNVWHPNARWGTIPMPIEGGIGEFQTRETQPGMFSLPMAGASRADILKDLEEGYQWSQKALDAFKAYQQGGRTSLETYQEVTGRPAEDEEMAKGLLEKFETMVPMVETRLNIIHEAYTYLAGLAPEEADRFEQALARQSQASTANTTHTASPIQKTWLGIEMREASAKEKKEGATVIVKSVKPDSPAAKAGLKAGDGLLKIENQAIAAMAMVPDLIKGFTVGSKVKIEVLREGKPLSMWVTLENQPEP